MDKGIIYKITNHETGMVYIGKTIQKLQDRVHDHFSKWSTCTKLKKAIDEFGEECFSVDILEEDIPYSNLDAKEVHYISLYDSVSNGYNVKEGNKRKTNNRDFHRINQVVRDRVSEDYLNGVSPLDIAEHFKICLTSVYNILAENGVKKRYNKGGFNSKAKINIDELIKLKAEGYSISRLAKYFNANKSSVKRMVARHKDIISPRVSDILAGKAEDENVL
jgi:group I intron endonuclease